MMRTPLFFLAALSGVLATAAVGCKRAGETQAAATTPALTAPTAPSVPAPAWKLRTPDGREVSSTDFAGKVMVVNFWATWCPPCRAEIPDLIELQKKYGNEGLVIVGISLDQDGAGVVGKFVEAKGINYPVVLGDDAVVAAFGGFEGIPTTFIIDRQGQIRDRLTGADTAAGFEKRFKPFLTVGQL